MILVYSENNTLVPELIGKARELAQDWSGPVIVAALDENSEQSAQQFIHYGADIVVIADKPSASFKVEEYTDVLEQIVREYACKAVLIGSTKNGKELAPRLASKLEAGCATDCIKVYLNEASLVIERIIFSGNAVATQRFTSYPCIVTIPAKTFAKPIIDETRQGRIITKKYETGVYASKILNIQKTASEGVNIEDARIIVSCGRGIKKKEDIKLIEELAQTLNAGAVGCSRPIAADLKWLSEDHWVGLSGHKVKPKLYIACGISGQVQHIAGMRDSATIVAINKDPEAPVFKSADYGIVGDLYTIIPELIKAFKDLHKN